MEIYNKKTSSLITENEFRQAHESVCFPSALSRDILLQYDCDVVLAAPQPTPTDLEFSVRDGVEVDALGNTVQKYKLVKRFPTEELEAAYLEQKLNDLKTQKKLEVQGIRETKERSGVDFTFSDALVGKIQTRNETDIRNIQAVTTSGLILQAQGIVDPVIQFRDESDVIHILTPIEAITLGMTVQSYIASTYSFMWDKKAQINAGSSIEELNNIDLNN